MVNLDALGSLRPVEQLDLSNYAVNKPKSFQLPPKGRYTLQAPPGFSSESFSRSKNGALAAQIDPKVVGGNHDGFEVKFNRIYATTWKRDGKSVSQFGDYLTACGFTGTLASEQEQADAIEATAGRVYEGVLDWKAYGAGGAINIEGMEKFPKNSDGTYQSWVNHPTETREDKDGNKIPARVFANVYVRDFLPTNQ